MAALNAREGTLDAQLWNAHSMHLEQFLYEKAFVTSSLGAVISDAGVTSVYRESPTPSYLQLTFNHLTRVLTPARHLAILLPPAKWGVNRFTAEFLGLPADICHGDDPQITPQRIVFAHELGHGHLRVYRNMTYSSWVDEFEADRNIRKHCMTLGDPASAAYALHLRTLNTFLTPFTPTHIKYWNTLAQRQMSDKANPVENIAAVLELKRHALAEDCTDTPLTTPEQIIKHSWGYAPELRMAGETLDSRLRLLAGLHHAATKAPLQLEATRTLAPHILAAARVLTPTAI